MKRRQFLGNAALFSVPMVLQGIPVFAGDGALHPFLQALTSPMSSCGKILIVIQLNGGNDGLNMIIPLDRYAELTASRPNILIPQASVLPLNGSVTTGMHPSMTGLRDLYNEGKVTIVQGVSYPNPNFSHFQAQDIWFTATSTLPTADTGWLGRQLDTAFPGYPDGYPNAENTDPPAIQIGGALPLALQGTHINMGYNAPNPAALVNVATATPAPAPASDYGTEITFLRMMKDQSNAYAARISAAYNAQATLSTMYPTSGNTLATQLQIVARLIGGGLSTPIYIVNHPDTFDNHVNQVVAGSPLTGNHANSLSKLSVAISAFQNDIGLMNKADKVSGMTFSEFGRRVINNASSGTDHGSGAPVVFFGAGVNPGVIGTSPVLPAVANGNTQVPLQYDFRQLYTSVMQQWLCMSSTESQAVLNGAYASLPIFTPSVVPVQGIHLTAALQRAAVQLNFHVFANDQYTNYVIERSTDAVHFTEIGSITNTSSRVEEDYQYSDDVNRAPQWYYRIKGIMQQGSVAYSAIVKLSSRHTQVLTVYPNPVTNHTIHLEFFEAVNSPIAVTIFGTKGEKLFYNQLNPQGNRKMQIKVPPYFDAHTLYVLHIVYDGVTVNEKILFE